MMSAVMFTSVIPRMYLLRPCGYCFCWILSLQRSRYACWMIEMCLDILLISLGIWTSGSYEASMSILEWVLAWCVSGMSNVTKDVEE